MSSPIIAIDGPAGAGKSTIARLVAQRLGYIYIDTGAMYRAVACKAIEEKIPISDQGSIAALARGLDIRFDADRRIWVDGEDLTEAVRSAEATRLSSPVSAIAGVRKRLVELQRKMGEQGGVVMEGRDIGTNVLPDAEVKVFLTASADERAKRRFLELKEKGLEADLDQIASEIRQRDLRDSSRKHDPLRQAQDAILVDTDGMSIEQVVDAVLTIHDRQATGRRSAIRNPQSAI